MVKYIFQFVICILLLLSCQRSSEEGVERSSANPVITPHPKIIRIQKPLVTLLDTCPPPAVLDVLTIPQKQTIEYQGKKISLKIDAPARNKVDFYSWLKNYTVEDGLASSSISCCFKDHFGNLWFGTRGQGASRFNGKTFTNFNLDNGLSDNSVTSILEDNQGNIWFGTKNGVSCYNGYYFKNYDTAKGLPNPLVTSLAKDKNGKIWVGTHGGLGYYDGHDSVIAFSENEKLPILYVSCLFIDSKGKLWIGGAEGACRFDGKQLDTLTVKQGLINNAIICFAEDRFGAIWMGTYGGASKYDGCNFSNFLINESPGKQAISCITPDHEGKIWFGTRGNGLYFYNEPFTETIKTKPGAQQKKFLSFQHTNDKNTVNDHIVSITEDNDGNMWFGTFGKGVINFDIANNGNCKAILNLLSPYVSTLSEDRDGNIWFNNNPSGITCYSKNTSVNDSITTFDFSSLLSHMLAVYVDKKNNVWTGTTFGAMKYDYKQLRLFTADQGFPLEINVRSIKEDRLGNLWFCTYEAGIIRYNENSTPSAIPKEKKKIKTIVKQDENGNRFEFFNTKNGFIDDHVPVCTEDLHGNMWFGSNKGVCYYKVDSLNNSFPHFIHFNSSDGLANNIVHSIAADRSGNIWFGTDDGLSRYDGHTFLNFNIEQGLVNKHVKGVACSRDGTIWIGTDNGLSKLSFNSKKNEDHPDRVNLPNIKSDVAINNTLLDLQYKPVFENYNLKNGYPISDVRENSLFIDSKNVIWVGTGEKLIMFSDNGFFEKAGTPKLQLQDVKINNDKISWNSLLLHRTKSNPSTRGITDSLVSKNDEVVTYGNTLSDAGQEELRMKFGDLQFSAVSPFYSLPQNLVLPFKYNNITFEYAAIKPANSDKVHYQYMLEGDNKDWQEITTQTSASFSNIFEGSYTFKVRAKTGYGVWGPPVSFSFRVLAPWYRTWWAYVIYVFTFVGVIWLVVKWRTKKLNKDKLILENTVKERTTEALNQKEEAERQRKIAEQSARAKENFLSNMSHEIRTPLNAISGYTGLSLEQDLPENIKKNLLAVKLSSDHLKRIVDDILDLSKIESGKFSFEGMDFDLEQTIIEVESMLGLKALEKRNKVYSHLSEYVPKILYGDKNRLIQVLVNLTDNAIKFTDNGRIDIFVDPIEVVNDNHHIRFTIKDNGIGITSDKQETIFESFTQADNTIARKFGGTGLGLTISKKIIELQGGKIEVSSIEHQGATFTFDLYFKKGKLAAPIPQNTSYINYSANPIRILAGEDDPLNRDLLGQLLTKWNVTYDFAESGIKLLALLKKNTYNLILVDIHMPDLNGFDVVSMIRTGFPVPIRNIPIIALTADVLPATKERIVQVGINDYLYKPVDAQLLFGKINQIMSLETQAFTMCTSLFDTYTHVNYFNPDYLIQNYGDSESHFIRFLNKSKLKLEEYICTLAAAHQEKDYEKMLLFSHRLLGVSKILGIENIPDRLLALDQLIHQMQPDSCIDEQLAIIQHIAGMACQEIDHFSQSIESKEIKI